MGKRRTSKQPRYHQLDMRDCLVWLHEAREAAVAAGREHRRLYAITTEALTWHALKERMLAAGLRFAAGLGASAGLRVGVAGDRR